MALWVAFFLAAFTASLGINEDQLIAYQAVLRYLEGQVLYRDFQLPHGPVSSIVLWPFFLVTKTGGFAMMLASAVLNLASTATCRLILMRLALPRQFVFWGSLVTAVWFLPPFGSYYNDHLAYLFVLLSTFAIIEEPVPKAQQLSSVSNTPRSPPVPIGSSSALRSILAGIFLALAFHTKQTVGLFGVVAFIASHVLMHRKVKRTFILSYAITWLMVIVGIAFFSDVHRFIEYTFLYPARFFLRADTDKHWYRPLTFLLFPYHAHPASGSAGQLLFYPFIIVIYLGYALLIRYRRSHGLSPVLLFSILSTLWCACLLGRHYSQLFFGLGIVFSLVGYHYLKEKTHVVATLGSTFCLLGVVQVIVSHRVFAAKEPFFTHTDLYPIRITRNPINDDAKKVVSYLQAHPAKFALLDDKSAIVAAALRKASVNSTLYFDDGLTIPLSIDGKRNWEKAFVNELDSKGVTYLVTALASDMLSFRRRKEGFGVIPIIHGYLVEHFKPVQKNRVVTLWQRKG